MTGRPGAPVDPSSLAPKNGLVAEINFEFVERKKGVVGRATSGRGGKICPSLRRTVRNDGRSMENRAVRDVRSWTDLKAGENRGKTIDFDQTSCDHLPSDSTRFAI